jgi:hypothetical protein
MSNMIAAILMIVGPVGAVVLAVLVVAAIGLMVYDLVAERRANRNEPARVVSPRDAEESISLKRGVARAFVILGGVFWGGAAFAGLYWFGKTGMRSALIAASVPLLATVVTLVVGWFWERVASVMLAAASAVAIYWGVVTQFEPGVWGLVVIALIGPMLTASVLFWLARTEEEALELSLALHPDLKPIAVERY